MTTGSEPKPPKRPRPLRLESLRVRVERNRVRFVVFVTAFVIGSAALLTLAFIAVPGSLIGLFWGPAGYWGAFWVVLAAAFGLALLVGGIAAYAQIANAEHWVRSQFRGGARADSTEGWSAPWRRWPSPAACPSRRRSCCWTCPASTPAPSAPRARTRSSG